MKQANLIESIRLEDGEYANIEYHQKRMERSCSELGIAYSSFPLHEFLSHISNPEQGLWKCRVLYSARIEKIEFKAYEVKKVHSLKLIHDNNIVYSHKYAERNSLTALYNQRGDCDDIILSLIHI